MSLLETINVNHDDHSLFVLNAFYLLLAMLILSLLSRKPRRKTQLQINNFSAHPLGHLVCQPYFYQRILRFLHENRSDSNLEALLVLSHVNSACHHSILVGLQHGLSLLVQHPSQPPVAAAQKKLGHYVRQHFLALGPVSRLQKFQHGLGIFPQLRHINWRSRPIRCHASSHTRMPDHDWRMSFTGQYVISYGSNREVLPYGRVVINIYHTNGTEIAHDAVPEIAPQPEDPFIAHLLENGHIMFAQVHYRSEDIRIAVINPKTGIYKTKFFSKVPGFDTTQDIRRFSYPIIKNDCAYLANGLVIRSPPHLHYFTTDQHGEITRFDAIGAIQGLFGTRIVGSYRNEIYICFRPPDSKLAVTTTELLADGSFRSLEIAHTLPLHPHFEIFSNSRNNYLCRCTTNSRELIYPSFKRLGHPILLALAVNRKFQYRLYAYDLRKRFLREFSLSNIGVDSRNLIAHGFSDDGSMIICSSLDCGHLLFIDWQSGHVTLHRRCLTYYRSIFPKAPIVEQSLHIRETLDRAVKIDEHKIHIADTCYFMGPGYTHFETLTLPRTGRRYGERIDSSCNSSLPQGGAARSEGFPVPSSEILPSDKPELMPLALRHAPPKPQPRLLYQGAGAPAAMHS